MAIIKKNTFNGGTNGAAVTSGNSGGASGDAFNAVSGSPTYTTTHATGSRAPLVATSGSYYWSFSLSDRTLYLRLYLYVATRPGFITTPVEIYTNSTSLGPVANIRMAADGKIGIENSSFNLVSGTATTNPIPTGQWVRIEARITAGTATSNGTCELRVYHDADSATPTETKTASGVNFGTTVPRYMRFNIFTDEYVDDVAIGDEDWIGPDRKDDEAAPSVISGTWSLPSPGISTGAGVTPATLTGTWALPEPEVTTADGLVPVNPATLVGDWSLPTPEVAAFRNAIVEVDTLVGAWEIHDAAAGVPVNPGDRISAPGQVEWNGFLLGGGGVYRLQQLDGWITDMPGIDSGNVPQPNRHGSYPGRKLSQERIVTLSGLIRARREEMEQAIEDLLAVTTVPEDDTEYPLAIRVLDTIYVGYGSVTRRAIPVDRQYRLGLGRLTLQWTLSDPVLLSRDLHSAVIADGATQILSNLGNAATYPLIRVPGPVTSPAVEIRPVGGQSRLLEFDLEIDEGQTLIIDVYYGTTMVGGADVQSTLSGSSTAVTDMVLAAGQNQVTYDGGGSAPDITVLWRHAYL